MIACVDVHYREDAGYAACVTFASWPASTPAAEYVACIRPVEPYVPGEFYRRELPCILEVLKALPVPPELVIVDGYVWLGAGKPGLGARLWEELGKSVTVVGVAKTEFTGAPSIAVTRGTATRPLYVTAAGIDAQVAAQHVASMAGTARIPDLLKRVDALGRQQAS